MITDIWTSKNVFLTTNKTVKNVILTSKNVVWTMKNVVWASKVIWTSKKRYLNVDKEALDDIFYLIGLLLYCFWSVVFVII